MRTAAIMAGLVIDIAVVILSLLAAVLFLPANNLAIAAARWIGARAASFVEPREPARITSSDGTVLPRRGLARQREPAPTRKFPKVKRKTRRPCEPAGSLFGL